MITALRQDTDCAAPFGPDGRRGLRIGLVKWGLRNIRHNNLWRLFRFRTLRSFSFKARLLQLNEQAFNIMRIDVTACFRGFYWHSNG